MSITSDPEDPRLVRGFDSKPVPQASAYLVLSDEERAKGFVRPVRTSYKHVGARPTHTTRELTPEEKARHPNAKFAIFEAYPGEAGETNGRFWTSDQLSSGCNEITHLNIHIAETYARDPKFYAGTYCVGCRMHLSVEEFAWVPDGSKVGS